MREIRITEKGEDLYISFWMGDEKISFTELETTEQLTFVKMIDAFTQYFNDIAELAKLHVINPN